MSLADRGIRRLVQLSSAGACSSVAAFVAANVAAHVADSGVSW
jgi:hypothetical protein